MTGKALRNLIITAEILVFLLLAAICVYGFLNTENFDALLAFGACLLRCTVMLAFVLFFYSSLFSGLGTDSSFLPLFILFSTIGELRILPLFTQVTNLCPYNPHLIASLIIFSYIFSGLCLFNFGYFYQEREQTSVNIFLFVSVIASLVLASALPGTQNIGQIPAGVPFSILIACIYAAAGSIFLYNIIIDPPGAFLIRHFAALLFLAANIANLYFDSRVAMLGSTAFTFISYVSVIVISVASDIKY